MRIQGPNGLVVDVPEAVATAMVGNGSRGYRFASEPETVKPARKPRRRTKTTEKAD